MGFHDEYKPAPPPEEQPVDEQKARSSDYRWGGFLAGLSLLAVAAVTAVFLASEPRSWKMLLAALPFLVLARYGLVLRRRSRDA